MFQNHIKLAWRNIRRNRTFAGINVLGLVLSVTSSLLIFAFIHFHLGFDNFHQDSARIYRIGTMQKRDVINHVSSVPPALGALMRRDYDFEEEIARIVTEEEALIAYGENQKVIEPEGVSFVEPAFFSIFNYPVIEGDLQSEFLQPGKAAITESMAKKYFGSSPAIGQTIRYANQVDAVITAVLKDLPVQTFNQSQIYISYPSLKTYNTFFFNDDSWGGISSNLQCFIKLKSGVSPAEVEKTMSPFAGRFRPNNSNVHTYQLQPLDQIHFSSDFGGPMPMSTLWTLAIIAFLLIISACLNFVNLAVAQVFNRLKEVGVRKSLGSGKRQLFGQFLTETSLLVAISMAFSFVLALFFLPFLNQLFDMNLDKTSLFNLQLFGFVIVLFTFISFFAGVYPGLLLSGFSPISALKGKLSNLSFGALNLRKSLITVQFVISQVLIIGMIVIIQQMKFNQNTELGFDKEAIVMVPAGSGGDIQDKLADIQVLEEKAGISQVSLCFAPPSSGYGWGTNVKQKGMDEEENFHVTVKAGDASYVPTFGLSLLAGRNVRPADSLGEILVNETFVKKMNYTSPEEAIGKYFSVSDQGPVPIVGVLKDFYTGSMHNDISPVVVGTFPFVMFSYAVKLNPKNLSSGLRETEMAWSSLHPDEVFTYEFVDESIKNFYLSEMRQLSLLKIFTGIAIFIGCLGLFGLISFLVERKTKEIGVRKVLGGSIGNILWLFGREFTSLIVISFAIAAPLAWYFSDRWLADFVYRIPMHAGIFISALAFTAAAAFGSVFFKVVKAATANPVQSLRSE